MKESSLQLKNSLLRCVLRLIYCFHTALPTSTVNKEDDLVLIDKLKAIQ